VDFASYAASFFNPYLFTGSFRGQLGCGTSALALLTGIPPEHIAKSRRVIHSSDKYMMRFLRAKGFHVLHLTQCNLSQSSIDIGASHVVLMARLFQENEGTWLVIFNGICFHNFDIYSLDKLSFLNKPILSAYLVFHPSWRLNQTPKRTLAPKVKPPADGITMNALKSSWLS